MTVYTILIHSGCSAFDTRLLLYCSTSSQRPHHLLGVPTQLFPQKDYYELINLPKRVNDSNLTAHSSSDSAPHPKLNPTEFKKRKGLGFIHLNIKNIIQQDKLDHLKILVTQTDPDIVVLSETWLRCTVNDSEMALNDFNLFRIDRNSRGGVVAIYI